MNRKAAVLLNAIVDYAPTGAAIVEIGCVRSRDEVASDGHSTVYLARAAAEWGCTFDSVDSDVANVEIARELVAGTGATVHHDDGATYLRRRPGAIGVLYLDGALNSDQAVEQYRAAKLAATTALVVIDDAQAELGLKAGKATGLRDVLRQDGFTVEIVATEPGYLMAVAHR